MGFYRETKPSQVENLTENVSALVSLANAKLFWIVREMAGDALVRKSDSYTYYDGYNRYVTKQVEYFTLFGGSEEESIELLSAVLKRVWDACDPILEDTDMLYRDLVIQNPFTGKDVPLMILYGSHGRRVVPHPTAAAIRTLLAAKYTGVVALYDTPRGNVLIRDGEILSVLDHDTCHGVRKGGWCFQNVDTIDMQGVFTQIDRTEEVTKRWRGAFQNHDEITSTARKEREDRLRKEALKAGYNDPDNSHVATYVVVDQTRKGVYTTELHVMSGETLLEKVTLSGVLNGDTYNHAIVYGVGSDSNGRIQLIRAAPVQPGTTIITEQDYRQMLVARDAPTIPVCSSGTINTMSALQAALLAARTKPKTKVGKK